jgi:hypothetical protein
MTDLLKARHGETVRWHYTPADLNNYLQTPRRMTPDELTAVTTSVSRLKFML